MRIVHRRKTDTPSGPRELDRHLPLQRREWRARQIGWSAPGLLLSAALAGLFGSGPLSSARASDPGGGLAVDCPRFVRASAAQRLLFEIDTPGGDRAGPRLRRAAKITAVDFAVLERSSGISIVPAPEAR